MKPTVAIGQERRPVAAAWASIFKGCQTSEGTPGKESAALEMKAFFAANDPAASFLTPHCSDGALMIVLVWNLR